MLVFECHDTQNILEFYFCITKRASVQLDYSFFLSTWFKVEGQVVERWERPTDLPSQLDEGSISCS